MLIVQFPLFAKKGNSLQRTLICATINLKGNAIKKIRDLRQRADADRIFRTITKDTATNIS